MNKSPDTFDFSKIEIDGNNNIDFSKIYGTNIDYNLEINFEKNNIQKNTKYELGNLFLDVSDFNIENTSEMLKPYIKEFKKIYIENLLNKI